VRIERGFEYKEAALECQTGAP